eukprot:GDKI01010515.1.p2 GENE.GDKI01010515.1~~GDKI01010515.1.p2  ORF type:complete len:128 (+),score=28.06 GDKI01010515.1:397-780(+)
MTRSRLTRTLVTASGVMERATMHVTTTETGHQMMVALVPKAAASEAHSNSESEGGDGIEDTAGDSSVDKYEPGDGYLGLVNSPVDGASHVVCPVRDAGAGQSLLGVHRSVLYRNLHTQGIASAPWLF